MAFPPGPKEPGFHAKNTMNVSLTPELERFIANKVESGLYNSASEVVRQALRLLVDQDTEQKTKLEALHSSIQDGIKSGEALPWSLEGFLQKTKALKSQEDS